MRYPANATEIEAGPHVQQAGCQVQSGTSMAHSLVNGVELRPGSVVLARARAMLGGHRARRGAALARRARVAFQGGRASACS